MHQAGSAPPKLEQNHDEEFFPEESGEDIKEQLAEMYTRVLKVMPNFDKSTKATFHEDLSNQIQSLCVQNTRLEDHAAGLQEQIKS